MLIEANYFGNFIPGLLTYQRLPGPSPDQLPGMAWTEPMLLIVIRREWSIIP